LYGKVRRFTELLGDRINMIVEVDAKDGENAIKLER